MNWTISQINIRDEVLIERLNGLLAALEYQPEQIDNLLVIICAVAFQSSHTDCIELGEKLGKEIYQQTSHYSQEMMNYISTLSSTR